jgi:hypothetical protein
VQTPTSSQTWPNGQSAAEAPASNVQSKALPTPVHSLQTSVHKLSSAAQSKLEVASTQAEQVPEQSEASPAQAPPLVHTAHVPAHAESSGVQVPVDPSTSQRLHSPAQAVSQQTPSTQLAE